jgi:hypothetical protein
MLVRSRNRKLFMAMGRQVLPPHFGQVRFMCFLFFLPFIHRVNKSADFYAQWLKRCGLAKESAT